MRSATEVTESGSHSDQIASNSTSRASWATSGLGRNTVEVKQNRPSGPQCFTCLGYGHKAEVCPNNSSANNDSSKKKTKGKKAKEFSGAALSPQDVDLFAHNKVVLDNYLAKGGAYSATDDPDLSRNKAAVMSGMLANAKEGRKQSSNGGKKCTKK